MVVNSSIEKNNNIQIDELLKVKKKTNIEKKYRTLETNTTTSC